MTQLRNIYYCRLRAINPLTHSMNSTWCALAPIKNGCFSSSWAVGRSVGFLVRHFDTKSWKSEDQRGLIGGGDFFTMLKITFCCVSLIQGGSPSAISIANMPNDQMSTFVVYFLSPLMSSGAIQQTVPTLLALALASVVSQQAQPKSANFTSPLRFIRMLSLLMSLCMMLRSCRQAKPSSVFLSTYLQMFSVQLLFRFYTKLVKASSISSTNIHSRYLKS